MRYLCRSVLGNLGDDWWSSFWEKENNEGGRIFGMVLTSGEGSRIEGKKLIDILNTGGGVEWGKWGLIKVTGDILESQARGFEIFVVRKRVVARLNRNGGKIKGRVVDGDIFLLASDKLVGLFENELVENVFLKTTIDEMAEELLSIIHKSDDQMELGGALIQIYPESGEEVVVNEVLVKKKRKIILKIPRWLRKKREIEIPQSTEYIKRSKWNLFLGVLVLGLLIVGVGLGYQKRREVMIEKNYKEKVVTVEEKIKMAQAARNMDPEMGLKLVAEAEEIVNSLLLERLYPEETEKLAGTLKNLKAVLGSPDEVKYELIFNTDIIDSTDKDYVSLLLTGENLYLIDRNKGRVEKVNWKLKSSEKIVEDQRLKGVAEIIASGKQVLAFDGKTVFGVERGAITEMGKIDRDDLVKLRVWSGYWYFLGKDGEIWKGGPGAKIQTWIAEKEEKLLGANDMAIDGRVWISNSSGEVKIYQKGEEEDWKIEAKISDGGVFRILTRPDSDRVVLVSSKMIRSYLKKNGGVDVSFNMEKVGIRDAAISDDGGEVLVLGQDQKIYGVKLSGEIFQ